MSTTITNVTELQAMENDLTEDYVLGNNIDASATSGWNGGEGFAPVGSTGSSFTGTFDGKSYTIDGLYINRSFESGSHYHFGLFGYALGATLHHVKFTNLSITITGGAYVGGLVGEAKTCIIYCVSVSGALSAATAAYGGYVGGITGHTSGTNGDHTTIDQCCSYGSVVGYAFAGGIAGTNFAFITNSFSHASVTCTYQEGGGLVGRHGGTIDNSYSVGAVGGGGNDLGGLVGWTHVAGGGEAPTDSFWDTETSGMETSDGGVGHTTSWMTTEANFVNAGWNFTTIWAIDSAINDGYPYFLWIPQPVVETLAATNYGTNTITINGQITEDTGLDCYYRFRYKKTADGSYTYTTWADSKRTNDTFYENLTGLTAQVQYEFAAQAKTICRISEWGETLYFYCGTYSFGFPDLIDDHGRYVKNAVVDAFRTDVHSEPYLIETQRTDANGTCSFSLLPIGQDIVFHARWGGIASGKKEEWFFLRVNEVEDGGTGAASAPEALDNLGVHEVAMMWELVLGD